MNDIKESLTDLSKRLPADNVAIILVVGLDLFFIYKFTLIASTLDYWLVVLFFTVSQVIVSGVLMRFFHVNFLKILERGWRKIPTGLRPRAK